MRLNKIAPSQVDATDLYRRHREDHNLETDELEAHGLKLFAQPSVHFDRTVEQSRALNDAREPCVIISASGMATGGRVLHHLERCLPDPRHTVLFVGFQGAGTRGQIIQSGAQFVKMYGTQVPIRARIKTLENLSAHADYGEILDWLGRLQNPAKDLHGPRRAPRRRVAQAEDHRAASLERDGSRLSRKSDSVNFGRNSSSHGWRSSNRGLFPVQEPTVNSNREINRGHR